MCLFCAFHQIQKPSSEDLLCSGNILPSRGVDNSPKTIRKYYMDQLRADHKREAEQELARADTDLVGDNVGDTLPCPSENAWVETGHADIESDVARFRDTHFALTPASADAP